MTTAGRAVALRDATAYHRRKRGLSGSLRGHVLEIGVGRGANFGLLHPDVRWTGLEPHRATRARLPRDAVGRSVLDAPTEAIPLEDGSVDAVLATVVLCSVRSPERAVAEVCRVLRPVVTGPHIAGYVVR
jgi:SAM-dependent methyltransferase